MEALAVDIQGSWDEFTKFYLENPPRDDNELHLFIEKTLGVNIPRQSVCPDHDSPFQFVSDLFFEKVSKALVLANRSGGKTYSVGALNTCEALFKPGCGIISIGGSEQQANKQYSYTQEFFEPKILNENLVDQLIHRTTLTNKSFFKILASSEKAVHHDHVPKVRMDEVELMEKKIYDGAISIPQSDVRRGIRQSVLCTSTRFKPRGMMQTLIDQSDQRGYRTYRWCYKEIAENCPDSRSGRTSTIYWINRKKRSILTQEQYQNLLSVGDDPKIRAGYVQKTLRNRCVNCILAPSCQGDLKQSNGYYLIDDLIDKYIEDVAVWDSQWECRRPYAGELTYDEWDTDMHASTKIKFLPELEVYCAIDFGYNCPFYACWFQVEPLGRVRVFKELQTRKKLVKWIGPELKKIASSLGVKVNYYGDVAGKRSNEITGTSPIGELKKQHGVRIIAKRIHIIDRVNTLRSKLIDAEGGPGVVVDPGCEYLVEAFETNHLPGEDELTGKESDEKPIKDNKEHPLDAFSTGLAHVFHKGRVRGY